MTYLLQRNSCPACDSDTSNEILSLDYDSEPMSSFIVNFYPRADLGLLKGETYILRLCNSCGLIFQQGVPNNTLANELYENWIDSKTSLNKKQFKGHWTRFRRISDEISLARALIEPNSRPPRVLDFGLGWGDWARMAAAYGCETFGIELSREKAKQAESSGIKILELENLPQSEFDYVNMEQVLEHLAAPWEVMKKLTNCLKPGGLLQVAVPNGNKTLAHISSLDWSTAEHSQTMPVHPLEHINCFSHDSLAQLGNRSGLQELTPGIVTCLRYQFTLENSRSLARSLIRPFARKYLQRVPKILFRKPL